MGKNGADRIENECYKGKQGLDEEEVFGGPKIQLGIKQVKQIFTAAT